MMIYIFIVKKKKCCTKSNNILTVNINEDHFNRINYLKCSFTQKITARQYLKGGGKSVINSLDKIHRSFLKTLFDLCRDSIFPV